MSHSEDRRTGTVECCSLEGGTERLKIRLEKTDVPAHYAKMGNLLSLNPEINRLDADPKVYSCVADCEWELFRCYRRSQCGSARRIGLGEVLCIHAYL